jgi:hypothetical protein
VWMFALPLSHPSLSFLLSFPFLLLLSLVTSSEEMVQKERLILKLQSELAVTQETMKEPESEMVG